ncbi:MAG: glycosyltransferase family 4 protein [Bacteroidota bacterium]
MFSIELLFDNLAAGFIEGGKFDLKRVEVPTENNFLTNFIFALRSRRGIHHITGDIHYIVLALGKRKTILTIHDCVFLTRYGKWDVKYWLIKYFWYQLPIHFSEVVTVISEKTKRELIRLTGVKEDKVKVIPNFYDPRFGFVPGNFNKHCPRILQLGTKSNKNINRLIEAIKFIPCELWAVGELEKDTKELLQKNNIRYISYENISFDALKNLYEQCDIVSFISTYEGFGLPILEAFAVGRPLLTSCISPMNEIAEDAAVKVNPYNIFDIRRGLLKIIEEDSFREELIEKGKGLVQKYRMDHVRTMYEDLYQNL